MSLFVKPKSNTIKSWISNIILFLVMLSMGAFWGIDKLFNTSSSYVATVGPVHITLPELHTALTQHVRRVENEIKRSLTNEEIQQSQLSFIVLQNLIHEKLLDHQADQWGLTVTQEKIRQTIQSIPAFCTQDGTFSARKMNDVLKSQKINESQLIAQVRQSLIRQQLTQAIGFHIKAHPKFAEILHNVMHQKRHGVYVFIPSSNFSAPTPSNEDLTTYYQTHREKFIQPAQRLFQFLIFRVQDFIDAKKTVDPHKFNQVHAEIFHQQTLTENLRHKIIQHIRRTDAVDAMNTAINQLNDMLSQGNAPVETMQMVKAAYPQAKLKQQKITSDIDMHSLFKNDVQFKNQTQQKINEVLQNARLLEELPVVWSDDRQVAVFSVLLKNNDAHIPSFSQIRSKILHAFQREKQKKLLSEYAQKLSHAWADGTPPTREYTRVMLPAISYSDAHNVDASSTHNIIKILQQKLFTLSVGQTECVRSSQHNKENGIYIVRLNNVENVSSSTTYSNNTSQQKKFMTHIAQSMPDAVLDAYVAHLMSSMIQNINYKMIQTLVTP